MGLDKSLRCDACGAQAYYNAYFWSGSLSFCRHHYRKHEDALSVQAMGVHDMDADDFV